MKVTTRLTLSEGVPDLRDAKDNVAVMKLQAAMPHVAKLEYVPDDEGSVSIIVGSPAYPSRDGESYMAGCISHKAALNLLQVLLAWRDCSYE